MSRISKHEEAIDQRVLDVATTSAAGGIRRPGPVGRTTGLRLLPGGATELSGRFTRDQRGRAQSTSIALMQADADFADAVPEADRQLAAGIHLPQFALEAGAWEGPRAHADDAPPAGLLVLDGLISRSASLYGRTTVELYGPGDIIGCDEPYAPDDLGVTWRVHQQSSLVDLHERFAIAAARWPALWHVVLRRCSMRASRLAAQLAALQLSRIDDRLEAVFWQLADRWGRVTPDGVVVPLTLTHAMLGQLTAAKRPTVSVALASLGDQRQIMRRPDGTWLLAQTAASRV